MSVGHCMPIHSASSRKLSSNVADLFFPLLLLFHLVDHSSGLRMTGMNTPVVADIREEMELECHYDMGREELYAVKWYKDDNEFFRYMPNPKPHTLLYPVAGVHLEPVGTNCSLGYCKVKLRKLSRDHSGGAYRCEISGEGPEFRLASETHNVTVAGLPRDDPSIEGLTTSYTDGDTVEAKCVSDLADPAPTLSWYINGQPPPTTAVGEQMSSQPNTIGLVSRSIGLRLLVERKLSRGNSIEIRCESAQAGVPFPPQATTHTVPLRSPNDPQVNNQKLHWYSGYSHASRSVRYLEIAWFVTLVPLFF